jgi:hypothetical protein
MDPNATLDLLRDELERGELECAAELFDALDTWLKRGGFLPSDWQAGQDAAKDATRAAMKH